jgi:diphthamide biosynthesis protein 7
LDGEYRFNVLSRFEEHKSMNYGSDFQPGVEDKLQVVSTSFYDKLLCVWETKV